MKKLLTILVLIMLIISFFQITSMYALYKEELQSDYATLLGIWAIKVNETDISSGAQELVFNISDDQVDYVSSEYVQTGKIAPGSQAYFDMVIDPSDTDVSIIYTIDIDTEATGSNNTSTGTIGLVDVESYFKLDGVATQTTNETNYTEGNSYTSIIPINLITQGYKNYIRLYFEWVNIETNNETDSELAEQSNAKFSIPVSINLKQYTGEVIGSGS